MTVGVAKKLVKSERKDGKIVSTGKVKDSKRKAVSHQDIPLIQRRSLQILTILIEFHSLSAALKKPVMIEQ